MAKKKKTALETHEPAVQFLMRKSGPLQGLLDCAWNRDSRSMKRIMPNLIEEINSVSKGEHNE